MMKIALLSLLLALSVSTGRSSSTSPHDSLQSLRGRVRIDGSSTVFPISEAVAEEFSRLAQRVRVTVGVNGTGGGFKRFCRGETDACNASRPITAAETQACASSGVEFIELPVAFDGLCVVVHPDNNWVRSLTMEQVRRIYTATDPARSWRDLDASWPDRPIRVYSPGTDSGTFDFFREVTVGKQGTIRSDMSVSEDDNVLVKGVEGEIDAIGYFGFAYFKENADRLRAVPIDGGRGPVRPSDEAILDGSYVPLSRPLFVYVNRRSGERPAVQAFVDFMLEHAAELSREVGYTSLPPAIGAAVRNAWETRRTGTRMLDARGERARGTLSEVLEVR